MILEDKKSEEIIKSLIIGDDVRNYHIDYEKRYLIFTRRGIDINQYPAVLKYLEQFKTELLPKPTDWKGSDWKGRKSGIYNWYEIQDTIDYYSEFQKPKIIWPEIAKESRFTFDDQKYFLNAKVFFTPTNDLYLLGLLNSKLIWSFLKNICSVLGDSDKGGRLMLQKIYVEQIPIRTINASDPTDIARHDRMVALVTQMLDLNKKLQEARLEQEKTMLSRQIEATDAAIDKLVYDLYGLTEEEINLVER